MDLSDRYEQSFRRQINDFWDWSDEQIIVALLIMRELRRSMAEILLESGSLNLWQRQRTMSAIDRTLSQVEGQMIRTLQPAMREAMRRGVGALAESMKQVGYDLGFSLGLTDPVTVATLNDFTSDLITGVIAEVRANIARAIKLAALGGGDAAAVMMEIQRILGIDATGRVIGGIASRVEFIYRTELSRAFNMINWNASQQTSDILGLGLKKKWVSARDARVRPSHVAIDAETDIEPIPLNSPFIVGGAPMMYPLDPNGPAREVVNCRCLMMTLIPSLVTPDVFYGA